LKEDYDAQRTELDNAMHDLAVICKDKDAEIERLRAALKSRRALGEKT
jgi:hypothetical protein